ncbi:unnamed protein product [Didymodactylos carnosus]|nr:unnamed protein product [Didymodactylos carnosus]CAF4133606.1 unnamed protein product [Didymodactylos carnosus]
MYVDIKYGLILPIIVALSCLLHRILIYNKKQLLQQQIKNVFIKLQHDVIFNAIIAYTLTIGSFLFTHKYFTINKTFKDLKLDNKHTIDIILFTLRWYICQIIPLFWGIAVIANKRYFSEKSIQGGITNELDMDIRYLQNTLEQVILSCIINLIATSNIQNINHLSWIAMNSIFFLTGRILFWYLYTHYPLEPGKRACGFGLTFYPSILT